MSVKQSRFLGRPLMMEPFCLCAKSSSRSLTSLTTPTALDG